MFDHIIVINWAQLCSSVNHNHIHFTHVDELQGTELNSSGASIESDSVYLCSRSQRVHPALDPLVASLSSLGLLVAPPHVHIQNNDQGDTGKRDAKSRKDTRLCTCVSNSFSTFQDLRYILRKGLLTVYLGLSRLVKAKLAMMPPSPPPIRHVAEATARLECCVMLLAWKVRTPGMQNWRKPMPVSTMVVVLATLKLSNQAVFIGKR